MAGKRKIDEQFKAALAENRGMPNRVINKLDAIRHLLHASIRLTFLEEDPFLVHMAVQSCDKLIEDYARHHGIDGIGFSDILRPERAHEFWHVYREAYNYFKHADFDVRETLPVYGIVESNELGIVLNISRVLKIGLPSDQHMSLYNTYVVSYYPDIQEVLNVPLSAQILAGREVFMRLTRAEMMNLMRQMMDAESAIQRERDADLIDVRRVGQTRPR